MPSSSDAKRVWWPILLAMIWSQEMLALMSTVVFLTWMPVRYDPEQRP